MSCCPGRGSGPPPPVPDPPPEIETNALTPICNPSGAQIGWVHNIYDEIAGTSVQEYFDLGINSMPKPATIGACGIDYEFQERCWRDIDDHLIQHIEVFVIKNGDLANAATAWILADGTITTTAPANIEPCPTSVPIQWTRRVACDLDTGQLVEWKEGCDANGNIVFPNGGSGPVYYGQTSSCVPTITPLFTSTTGGGISTNNNGVKFENLTQAESDAVNAALQAGCLVRLRAEDGNGGGIQTVIGGPGWDGNFTDATIWHVGTDLSVFGTDCPTEVESYYTNVVQGNFGWTQVSYQSICFSNAGSGGYGPLNPQPTNVGECPDVAWSWREACDLSTGELVHYIEGITTNGDPVYPYGAMTPVYYGCVTNGGSSANSCIVTSQPGFVAQAVGSQGVAVISDNGTDYIKVEGFTAAEIATMDTALSDGCILIMQVAGLAGESATMVAGGPGWDGNSPGNQGAGAWYSEMDFTNTGGGDCAADIAGFYSQFSPAANDFNWIEIKVSIRCFQANTIVTSGPLNPQPTNVGCCPDPLQADVLQANCNGSLIDAQAVLLADQCQPIKIEDVTPAGPPLAETPIQLIEIVQEFAQNSNGSSGSLGAAPVDSVSVTAYNASETRVQIQIGPDVFSVPPGGSHTANVVRDGVGLIEEYLGGEITYQFANNLGDGIGNDKPTLILNFKVHQ